MHRIIYRLSFLLLLANTGPVFASDCEKSSTNMAEIRSCVADGDEQELNATYKTTLAYVRKRDPKSAELLIAAQKSWEKFAADSCNYAVAARQTDRMENDARLLCWQSFRDARIKILKAYRQQFGKSE